MTTEKLFTGSQVNLYADDVENVVGFYTRLGFVETYRYAPDGDPWHVEVEGAGLTLGVASPSAALADHGLEVTQDGAAMEIVLWCDDVDAAFELALEAGATPLRQPHDFQNGRLRVGWVSDPVGNPIELVQQKR
jgi:predicted enzyme related to lactoylglutathione lyase